MLSYNLSFLMHKPTIYSPFSSQGKKRRKVGKTWPRERRKRAKIQLCILEVHLIPFETLTWQPHAQACLGMPQAGFLKLNSAIQYLLMLLRMAVDHCRMFEGSTRAHHDAGHSESKSHTEENHTNSHIILTFIQLKYVSLIHNREFKQGVHPNTIRKPNNKLIKRYYLLLK